MIRNEAYNFLISRYEGKMAGKPIYQCINEVFWPFFLHTLMKQDVFSQTRMPLIKANSDHSQV
jgi:hypothetical protein